MNLFGVFLLNLLLIIVELLILNKKRKVWRPTKKSPWPTGWETLLYIIYCKPPVLILKYFLYYKGLNIIFQSNFFTYGRSCTECLRVASEFFDGGFFYSVPSLPYVLNRINVAYKFGFSPSLSLSLSDTHTHAHTHTHTHYLSFFLSLSNTHTLSLSNTRSLSLSFSSHS